MKNPCLILLTIILFSACDNELTTSDPEYKFYEPTTKQSISRIAFVTQDLSTDDACIIANLESLHTTNSRTDIPLQIKNIVPILDSNGEPAIYAVNYTDGYVLISATTKYFPILAEIEHGSFSLENLTKTGQDIVISEMIHNIEQAKNNNISIDCKHLWARYKEDYTTELHSKSRAYDDINSAIDALVAPFDMQFASRLYRLTSPECRELLPENVYAEFCHVAETEDFWAGTPYCWENTAMVIATDYTINGTEGQIGPFITTEWGQCNAYNTTGHDALGCITIATAQLMKYFRHPEDFSWEKMPNKLSDTESCPTLTNFLAQLRRRLFIKNDGSGDPDNIPSVLNSYGYSTYTNNHDLITIDRSLRDHRPVLANGYAPDFSDGHSWIIDGYRDTYGDVEYVLYRLADYAYPQFEYAMTEPDTRWGTPTFQRKAYHMNWGWYGWYNGWYYEDQPTTAPLTNYYNSRFEIIVNL